MSIVQVDRFNIIGRWLNTNSKFISSFVCHPFCDLLADWIFDFNMLVIIFPPRLDSLTMTFCLSKVCSHRSVSNVPLISYALWTNSLREGKRESAHEGNVKVGYTTDISCFLCIMKQFMFKPNSWINIQSFLYAFLYLHDNTMRDWKTNGSSFQLSSLI